MKSRRQTPGTMSANVTRAMSANREESRRHTLHSGLMDRGQHRARCDFNVQIQQMKGELYKISAKTPTLRESMHGISLAGLDNSLLQDANQVSKFYELGEGGKLVKSGSGPKKKAPGERNGRPSRISSAPPAPLRDQQKANSEQTRLHRPYNDRAKTVDGMWVRPTTITTEDMKAILDYCRQKFAIENEDTDKRPVTPVRPGLSRASSAVSKHSTCGNTSDCETALKELRKMEGNWRMPTASANPYQDIFKIELITIRRAQKVALAARKLHNLEARREEALREEERREREAEQRLRRIRERERHRRCLNRDDDDDDMYIPFSKQVGKR